MSDLTPSIKSIFNRNGTLVAMSSIACAALLGLAILNYYTQSLADAFLPGVQVDGVALGGQTLADGKQTLLSKGNGIPEHLVVLSVEDFAVSSSSAQLGVHRELEPALSQAFAVGKDGNWLQRIWKLFETGFTHPVFSTKLAYEPAQVESFINTLKTKVDIQGRDPSAKLGVSGSPATLTVDAGKDGRTVLVKETTARLNQALNDAYATRALTTSPAPTTENNSGLSNPKATTAATPSAQTSPSIALSAAIASTSASLTQDEQVGARERALLFVGTKVTATSPDHTLYISDTQLIALLTFPGGTSDQSIDSLIDSLEKTVTRKPQDAAFVFDENSLAVTEFAPHRDGLTLDRAATKHQLRELVFDLEATALEHKIAVKENASAKKPEPRTLSLPVTITQPETTLAKTNKLGIVERIGMGESNYEHSMPGRVFNVGLTAKKINNTIIKPGEEFSFNKTLGEVSSRTGFKPAYVIKSGQTVLGDGGGVCQVSTTLFRALLDGGLQITKRKPHSYRVSYYELNSQAGFDATVFAGDVDLRFKNDTDHHVLIHTQVDEPNLYLRVELYGTSDGRSTEISNYRTWDYRAPLATQFIPDPTLPSGKKVQVDWSQSGLKTSFKHTIKNKDGSIRAENEYASNYQPWAAKYRVGI